MEPTIRHMGIADSRRMGGIGGGPSVVSAAMEAMVVIMEEDSMGLLAAFRQDRRPLPRRRQALHLDSEAGSD